MDDIISYDPDADRWVQVGHLTVARSSHAVSVLPLEEVEPFCLSWIIKNDNRGFYNNAEFAYWSINSTCLVNELDLHHMSEIRLTDVLA